MFFISENSKANNNGADPLLHTPEARFTFNHNLM